MKRRVILISIQIFVVAIAIALTATTYAWFVSQTNVSVTPTTVTAAAGANTLIESEEPIDHDPYKGETGQGYVGDGADGVDAPYVVGKKLTVSFSPIGGDSAMTARIISMKIVRSNGTVIDSEGEDGSPEVIDNFTWRITVGGYEYGPDGDGFLSRVDENGDVKYFEVPEAVENLEIAFYVVFLDEASYDIWLNAESDEDYGNVKPFAYCAPEYMKAQFICKFEIGIAPHAVVDGEIGDGGEGA